MDAAEVVVQLKCNDKCNIDGTETISAAKKRARAVKKLSLAVCFCIVFVICEVVGGVMSNSLAILTDAAHLLSDIAGFAIALFAIYASGWEANPRQTFGYYRLEILGALLSIQIIWLVTGVLIYEAILRFIHPNKNIDGLIMFGVACSGLGVNIILMCTLGHGGHGHLHGHGHDHNHDCEEGHGHGHDHGHGEGHGHGHGKGHGHGGSQSRDQYNHEHREDDEHNHKKMHKRIQRFFSNCIRKNNHDHKLEILGKKLDLKLNNDEDHEVHEISIINHDDLHTKNVVQRTKSVTFNKDLHSHKKNEVENINVRTAYLHALGDFVQSIGVMIAGAIIWFKPDYYIVDPICTIVFSVMVLATTYNMIQEIVGVLMESTPREIDASALEEGLLKLNGVVAVHELHIWAITIGRSLLACHIEVEPQADTNEVLHTVTQYVEKVYNISHVTIQIEQRLS